LPDADQNQKGSVARQNEFLEVPLGVRNTEARNDSTAKKVHHGDTQKRLKL
jgi:hypothetical protein